MLLFIFPLFAQTSNIDATDKWAWGTNIGWVNFRSSNGGVTVYSDHLEGYAWAENIGWIRMGTHTGGSPHTYDNDASDNYGVNHDGAGNLSGYAWSTNAGWINFNPSHSQVTMNMTTGSFDGYAWGENVGWIHFKNASPAYNVVCTNNYTGSLIYYIDASKTDDSGDGLSWATAKKTLQAALDLAISGDTIWIKKGTYHPTSAYDMTNTSRYYHWRMKEGAAIYGGFAGTETSIGQRTDFGVGGANETILSGDLNDDDVVSGSGISLSIQNNTENCYHVFYHPSSLALTTAAILDGVTISGGNADDFPNDHAYSGGGMFNEGCSPFLNNIAFIYNNAIRGGALYLNNSNLVGTNLIIQNNRGAFMNGGGINMYDNSSTVFTNCLITGNRANNGGGMYMLGSGNTPTFVNTTIAGNYASMQGGGFYSNEAEPDLQNCILWGNLAATSVNKGNQICTNGGTVALFYTCYGNEAEDIYTVGTFTPDGNCITDDPLFVNASNNNYRIFDNSPCADTGNDSYNALTTEIRGEGFGRKLDKTNGDPGTIDMGAYEYKYGTDPINELIILSLDPTENAVGVDFDTDLMVTFDRAAQQSSIDATSFVTWGSQSGLLSGSLSFSNGDTEATFTPTSDLFAGEIVRTVLTDDISNTTGAYLSPIQWQVTAGLAVPSYGGNFTEMSNALLGVAGKAAWGDYDQDGHLDFVISGITGTSSAYFDTSVIYHNNGDGTFTDIQAGIQPFQSCNLEWGDYDNDHDLDLLIAGYTNQPSILLYTKLYRNDGGGTFTDINAGFPGSINCAVAWADYDNDGYLDFLLIGRAWPSGSITKLYHNDGDGTFTENTTSGLPADYYFTMDKIAWGDYDNDGYLDFALTGSKMEGYQTIPVLDIYHNNHDGTFTENSSAGFVDVMAGSIDWGDYNRDGYLDLAVCGYDANQFRHTSVYENNGDGTFTDINPGMTGITGSINWGDYDNDGYLDIALAGRNTSTSRVTEVYRNTSGTGFTQLFANFTESSDGAVVWGDFDNDNDLDLLRTGRTNGDPYDRLTILYRNDPVPPEQATNVQFANVYNYQMKISWERGNGDSCAVFLFAGDTGTAEPETDIYYAADANFMDGDQIGASGWYGVYRGTGTEVTVTGLSSNTIYRAHVCEFLNGSIIYNTDTSTGNPANQTTENYFYRTIASGNWSSTDTWEQSTEGNIWVTAVGPPDENCLSITIRNGHDVNVDADVTIDQTTIESGASLAINSGITLYILDGDGTDLTVNGTLDMDGGALTVIGTIEYGASSTLLYSDASTAQTTTIDELPVSGCVNLTIANSNGVSLENTTTISGNLNVGSGSSFAIGNNNFTTQGFSDVNGTLSVIKGTFDAVGTFDATGGAVTFTSAGTLELEGTVTSLGTFTSGSGTVLYNGSADQAIFSGNDINYNTVELAGGGTKTVSDVLVANFLTLANENFNVALLGDGTTITNAVDFQNTGTVTLGDAYTDVFTFTGGISIKETDGPSAVILQGTLSSTNADVTLRRTTITGDATINSNNNKIDIYDNLVINDGVTLTVQGGSVSPQNWIYFHSTINSATGGTGNLSLNPTFALKFDGNVGSTTPLGTVAVNGGYVECTSPDITVENLVINGGQLGSAGSSGNLDVENVTITSGATLVGSSNSVNVSGNWTNNGTFTHHDGTVVFDGSDTQTIMGTNIYYNATISNTHAGNYVDASSSTLAVTNLLHITDGQFKSASDYHDVSIGADGTLELSGDITVSGDWINSGTFMAGSYLVTLDGVNQSISGNSTFYDLKKNVSSAATLTFENGSTQTISDSLDLQGAADNLLYLRSDSEGTQWIIDVPATVDANCTIGYLDIKDSNNIGEVVQAHHTNSIDSGNNIGWNFDYVPSLTTEAVTDILHFSATGNGTITDIGDPEATQHGVCWSTETNPSIDDENDFKTEEGVPSGTGSYTSDMTGLLEGTTYYVRAYATDAYGTGYGSEVSFTTNYMPDFVYDGTTYYYGGTVDVEVDTNEDTTLTFDLQVTDQDAGQTFSWNYSNATHGTVSINESTSKNKPGSLPNKNDGSSETKEIVFTPTAEFNGDATFTIEVGDGVSTDKSELTFNVTINAINDAPVCTVDPVLSGNPYVNEELSVSDGTWNDDLDVDNTTTGYSFNPTYTYQWQVESNSDDSNFNNISGATNSTFTVPDTYYNKIIRCLVTCTDDGEGTPATNSTTVASNSVEIINTAPVFVYEGTTYASGSLIELDAAKNTDLIFNLMVHDDNAGQTITWNSVDEEHGFVSIDDVPTDDPTEVTKQITFTPETDYMGAAGFTISVMDNITDATSTLEFDITIKPYTVYVNDDWTGYSYGDTVQDSLTFGKDAFLVVNNAVEGVATTGTIRVFAGTYGNGIVINKSITMITDEEAVITLVTKIDYALEIAENEVTINGFLFNDVLNAVTAIGEDITITNCKFENCTNGVINTGTDILDARRNWWDDLHGPKHPSNPNYSITTGSVVSDYVNFFPWNATTTVTDSSEYVTVYELDAKLTIIAVSDVIQDGIDAAVDGNVVEVADGTYTEDLVVDKSIILRSENGRDNTTIQQIDGIGIEVRANAHDFMLGGVDQGFSVLSGNNTTHAIRIVNEPSGVSIIDNVIDIEGYAFEGISINSSGADSITINDNQLLCDSGDSGLWLPNSENASINDNDFICNGSPISGWAMHLNGNTNPTVSGNTIDNFNIGINLSCGVGFIDGEISSNEISNCSHSIYISQWSPSYSFGTMQNLELSENNITTDQVAVYIGDGQYIDASTFVIHYNNFNPSSKEVAGKTLQKSMTSLMNRDQHFNRTEHLYGFTIAPMELTDYGIYNAHTTEIVTAEDNWWGDINGPYHDPDNVDTNGQNVSDHVDFRPWAIGEPAIDNLDHEMNLTITSPGSVGDVTSSTPIPFVVDFDEIVHNFDKDTEISIVGDYTNTPTISDDGNGCYTFSLVPEFDAASMTVSVAAQAAEDIAGNYNQAVDLTITYDALIAKFIITVTPSSPYVNNFFDISLEAVDAYNYRDTDYNGLVMLGNNHSNFVNLINFMLLTDGYAEASNAGMSTQMTDDLAITVRECPSGNYESTLENIVIQLAPIYPPTGHDGIGDPVVYDAPNDQGGWILLEYGLSPNDPFHPNPVQPYITGYIVERNTEPDTSGTWVVYKQIFCYNPDTPGNATALIAVSEGDTPYPYRMSSLYIPNTESGNVASKEVLKVPQKPEILYMTGRPTKKDYSMSSYVYCGSAAGADNIPAYADIRVFLEGPYVTGGTMTNDLYVAGLLPADTPENAVDIITVELRYTLNGETVKSIDAYLMMDGSIVTNDGDNGLPFYYTTNNKYFIAIKHRNHLDVITAAKYSLSDTLANATDIDLTHFNSVYMNGFKEVETDVYAMYAGDANSNGQIQNNDKNEYWKVQVGQAGYLSADFDLNGQVQNSDKNIYWKTNVGYGSSLPEQTKGMRKEHLTAQSQNDQSKDAQKVGVTVTFANGTLAGKYYEFDVMLQSDVTGMYLGDSQVYIHYNTLGFGEQVALNDRILVTKGTLLAGEITSALPLYSVISTVDNTSSHIAITTEYNFADSPCSANEIPAAPTQLLHIALEIADVGQSAALSFEQNLMSGQIYHSYNTETFLVCAIDADDHTLCTPEENGPAAEQIFATKLIGSFPNPVIHTSKIKYQIKGSVNEQNAAINIYNIRGELVKTIVGVNGIAKFETSDLGQGVYLYALENEDSKEIKRLIVFK